MKRIVVSFAFFFLLKGLPGSAYALEISKTLPNSFCESARSVSRRVSDCKENEEYFLAAKKCFQEFEALEKTYGQEAIVISRKGEAGQKNQVSQGQEEYEFAQRVMGYLIPLNALALKELGEYPLHMNPPEDFFNGPPALDPFTRAEQAPCYGGNKKSVKVVVEAFRKKGLRLEARKNDSITFQRKLIKEKKGLVGENQAHALPSPSVALSPISKPNPGKDTRKSSISGIKEKETPSNSQIPTK